MKNPVFTPALLDQYLEKNRHITAATADFHTDEVRRLQHLYAAWQALYHQVQQADTDGVRFVTLESLTQTVKLDIGGIDFSVFSALLEPIINKLHHLERQIVAMQADLPRLQQEFSPTAETAAVLALCLPQPSMTTALPTESSSQAA